MAVVGIKTDRAAELLSQTYLCLGWPGGAKIKAGGKNNSSLGRVNLSPLQGKQVIVFPDHDKPGLVFAAALARKIESLQDQEHRIPVRIVRPDSAWPEGHDIADLIKSGWDATQLLDYIGGECMSADGCEGIVRERFGKKGKPVGNGTPIPDIPTPAGKTGTPERYSESRLADCFQASHTGDFYHVEQWDDWLQYSDGLWRRGARGVVRDYAENIAREQSQFALSDAELGEKASSIARKVASNSTVAAIEKLSQFRKPFRLKFLFVLACR
jgi:putative DNA primase/helicase